MGIITNGMNLSSSFSKYFCQESFSDQVGRERRWRMVLWASISLLLGIITIGWFWLWEDKALELCVLALQFIANMMASLSAAMTQSFAANFGMRMNRLLCMKYYVLSLWYGKCLFVRKMSELFLVKHQRFFRHAIVMYWKIFRGLCTSQSSGPILWL